jgi:hypothetical protein
MKKNLLRVLSLVSVIGTGYAVKAQYPVIPTTVQEASDRELEKAKQRSDEAWQKALPIVEREAKNGRPYVPWASKPSDLIKANIPAFPGAEGGGAYTPGGRGGKVYVVTNLNDDGPGSFRWACEQGGARIVVFNIAGIIRLKSPVIIRAPYITIAGQTAPGDGVCIAGESVWIDTHDVIIRHMRFRRGETNVARRDDALGGNPVGNIMIDHVSASWGLDENMSIYRHLYNKGGGSKPLKLPTVNVTIQNSISSEGLDTYNHAFGSTIGGGGNTTFMRNLWACNVGRNPSIGMDEAFNFVNNVVFNWWNRTADGGGNNARFNFINNYYKPGPVTPANRPISYRIVKMEGERPGPDGKRRFGYTYAAGNIVHGNAKITDDNWAGGVQLEDMSLLPDYVGQIRANEPFPMAKMTIVPANEAYEYVLKNAGATLPKRDAVDERIVRQVRTGNIEYKEGVQSVVNTPYIKRRLPEDSYKSGIITDPAQVGGYPEYKGTPYKDADSDGMPDGWERKNNLNPNDASDASKDRDGDGYTNIEEYINNLVA